MSAATDWEMLAIAVLSLVAETRDVLARIARALAFWSLLLRLSYSWGGAMPFKTQLDFLDQP